MATADTTRLLVLGVAQIFEPANGYQLRRELLSWSVEDWAHINPGSIYSMLSTLAKQGMLERVDIAASPDARPVAVYRTTKAGRAELIDLIRAGITGIRAFDNTEFYAAMSLAPTLVEREEIVRLLQSRRENITMSIEFAERKMEALSRDTSTPPHVAKLLGYAAALQHAEWEWVGGFAEWIRSGDMEHDLSKWEPRDDDPAWRMVRERELYLKKLAERG
jgi:DNA-binding PadR family transcriptional regulator